MKPLIEQRADPQIYRHTDGYWYFTASVPEFDRIEIRRAKTLEGLATATPRVIWRKHETGLMSCNIWAPEMHWMDGQWVVYFAAAYAGADEHGCYDHRIYMLRCEGNDPMRDPFVEMGQMLTGWESFSLDATTFASGGEHYFVWAQRDPGIMGNSNLYIARMRNAFHLATPAVLLTRPEYGWECEGFLVNEGPAVLRHDGRLYLTYSASATDERYCMGMLTANEGDDLLNPSVWRKESEPVFSTSGREGIYGPGHNSFTTDEHGKDILVFHARPYAGFHGTALSDPNRHTYRLPIHYDDSGRPQFLFEGSQ